MIPHAETRPARARRSPLPLAAIEQEGLPISARRRQLADAPPLRRGAR